MFIESNLGSTTINVGSLNLVSMSDEDNQQQSLIRQRLRRRIMECSTTISKESTPKQAEMGRVQLLQGVKCKYSKCNNDAGFCVSTNITPRTFCSCSCRAKHTAEIGHTKCTFDTWDKQKYDEMIAARSHSRKYIDSLKVNSHGRLTMYKGILMRSITESMFAKLCDILGWKWEYETKFLSYLRPNNQVHNHLVDFYFPEDNLYVQVKYRISEEDRLMVSYISNQLNVNYDLWDRHSIEMILEELDQDIV